MKAFLSYSHGDNIYLITKLLQEKGVEIVDSFYDTNIQHSLQLALKQSIEDCDFVFIIYTKDNVNIAFEVGLAVSLKKPIFAVVANANDADFLFDSTYVQATPDEIDKIKFNLDIFLKNIKPKTSSKTPKSIKTHGAEILTFYDDILNKYNNLKDDSEGNYEDLFEYIFNKYRLSAVQNKCHHSGEFYTDFSIWSDELNSIFGNPILIEVKKEINPNNYYKILQKVENLSVEYPTQSLILFYDKLVNIKAERLPQTSKILFVKIYDFINNLNHGDFNQSLREIRNEIIHKKLNG